jgi:guanylate cyclase soluble subunit beta
MYGMIHRGIRQMICDEAGEAAWAAIERDLDIGPEHLISADSYDDALTFQIVDHVARLSGQAMDEWLLSYGRYWIGFAESSPYGAMMRFTGRDIVEFITNLDRMHHGIKSALPAATMPSFTLLHSEAGLLRVAYSSPREGLEPFVQGLLEGLLTRFGHDGKVAQITGSSNTVEFEVRF